MPSRSSRRTALLLAIALSASTDAVAQAPEPEQIRAAGELVALDFSDDEMAAMASQLLEHKQAYTRFRGVPLDNDVMPALIFEPLMPGVELRAVELPARPLVLPSVTRPADLADLAFADIPTLAALIAAREVSCLEITELFLARLRRADESLECVIEFTDARARRQAQQLDEELSRGHWRGVLHGIPWGAKDLLSVKGTRTTWGAEPYREQRIEHDATVVERLDAAGAVLIAKLSLGALAYGDVWFGGTTRNPWNLAEGSSGSSAGPAAAVAAGAVPFAIGSETYGSIVSPSQRCGVSSLRPTFGRVSRDGAMALVWSMDKLGPMCRTLDDTALVLDAIAGADGRDPTARDVPFTVPRGIAVAGLRVGVPRGAFDGQPQARVLDELRALGVELIDIDVPDPQSRSLNLMLHAEAAAAFDEITRDGRDDELTRQDPNAWPNLFRAARLIPAVEYIRAARLRTQVMRATSAALAGVDVVVHPPYRPDAFLMLTNHTGHPTVVAPCGFREDGTPYSICFTGQLFDEGRLIAVAGAWQRSTNYHERHPAP